MVTRREYLEILKRKLEKQIEDHPALGPRRVGIKVKGGRLFPGRLIVTFSTNVPKGTLPPGFDEDWLEKLEERFARETKRPLPPKPAPPKEQPLIAHLKEVIADVAKSHNFGVHPIPLDVRELRTIPLSPRITLIDFEVRPRFPPNPAARRERG